MQAGVTGDRRLVLSTCDTEESICPLVATTRGSASLADRGSNLLRATGDCVFSPLGPASKRPPWATHSAYCGRPTPPRLGAVVSALLPIADRAELPSLRRMGLSYKRAISDLVWAESRSGFPPRAAGEACVGVPGMAP